MGKTWTNRNAMKAKSKKAFFAEEKNDSDEMDSDFEGSDRNDDFDSCYQSKKSYLDDSSQGFFGGNYED